MEIKMKGQRTQYSHCNKVFENLISSRLCLKSIEITKSKSSLLKSKVSSNIENSSILKTHDNDIDEEDLGAWIPIGSATALYGLGPVEITVMGQRLVVWNDLEKVKKKKKIDPKLATWSVMQDLCPHRLAPLSQGRIDPITNCIECPYHGWQFDNNGKVTHIPQMDDNNKKIPTKANGKSFPVHLAGDIIFAFLPSHIHGEMYPKNILPEHMYPWLPSILAKNRTYFTRDLPYSADFLVENFMDPAHIPFAHHGLQGLRSDGDALQMEKLLYNFTHVEVLFQDRVNNKTRNGVLSFQRPCFYHVRLEKNSTLISMDMKTISMNDHNQYKVLLGIFVIPISAGKTRVMFASFLPSWVPMWVAHAASNRFLNTDTWLHDAEIESRTRSVDKEDYVYVSKSDYGTSLWRQWWNEFGFSKSPPNTFGPSSRSQLPTVPLTRRQQIDPWENHAKHCSSCRSALAVIKKTEVTGSLLIIISLIFFGIPLNTKPFKNLIFQKVGCVIGAGIGFWIHRFSKKCATVIEGHPYPSGIKDRSVAAMS